MYKIRYKSFVAFLFFMFFATPILNPYIEGSSVYVYWFIPFLDIHFVNYLYSSIRSLVLSKRTIFLYFALIVVGLLLKKPKLFLELLFIFETVLYCNYAYKNKCLKHLYFWVNVNIFIAILQFVLYYINPSYSYAIGPTNVAKIIWGSFAKQTSTNFFPDLLPIVKVSGWSTEAGFFNSLVIATYFIYKYVNLNHKKSYRQNFLFLIGFVISISKVSLLPLLVIPIIYFKKYIDKIPLWGGSCLSLYVDF